MVGILFAILSLFVFAAWLAHRRDMRATAEGRRPVLTDDHLREILGGGAVDLPEADPLDEEEIREAEDRFWEETEWDEPEEFHP